jgi:general secretion pathway protein B
MSFILDALRKSENERQRNTTPGIADSPTRARPAKRSVWIPLVAVLLGVNLSLIAVLWYTGDDATDATNVAAETPASSQPAVTRERPPKPALSPNDYPAPIADPNISRELSAELDPVTPSASGANKPKSINVLPTLDVPTLAELSLDGTLSLPPLHLDIHVYSDAPAERFVFINTSKYREGERTSEGPIVDEINGIGVVLMHQNRRFLLTRE